jgi:EAL domain-containing protein (putative c-di-GMP-specific phosphodiesterase class I)
MNGLEETQKFYEIAEKAGVSQEFRAWLFRSAVESFQDLRELHDSGVLFEATLEDPQLPEGSISLLPASNRARQEQQS